MASLRTLKLNREQLASFLNNNHLLIKQFENLQLGLQVDMPELIAIAQNTADQAMGLVLGADAAGRLTRRWALEALREIRALPSAASVGELDAAIGRLQQQIQATPVSQAVEPAPAAAPDLRSAVALLQQQMADVLQRLDTLPA